jgi:hypothetical protein
MYVHSNAADPVSYGWYRDPTGWHFVVNVPSWAGPSERLQLMQWLDSYAKTIRKERPLWAVQIRSGPTGFTLDARPSRDPAEFAGQLLKVMQENTYA